MDVRSSEHTDLPPCFPPNLGGKDIFMDDFGHPWSSPPRVSRPIGQCHPCSWMMMKLANTSTSFRSTTNANLHRWFHTTPSASRPITEHSWMISRDKYVVLHGRTANYINVRGRLLFLSAFSRERMRANLEQPSGRPRGWFARPRLQRLRALEDEIERDDKRRFARSFGNGCSSRGSNSMTTKEQLLWNQILYDLVNSWARIGPLSLPLTDGSGLPGFMQCCCDRVGRTEVLRGFWKHGK